MARYRRRIGWRSAPRRLIWRVTGPRDARGSADHLCLSHTVWTARNEWRLPGVEGEVRWKRDAVLRCNDGYARAVRRSPGPGC